MCLSCATKTCQLQISEGASDRFLIFFVSYILFLLGKNSTNGIHFSYSFLFSFFSQLSPFFSCEYRFPRVRWSIPRSIPKPERWKSDRTSPESIFPWNYQSLWKLGIPSSTPEKVDRGRSDRWILLRIKKNIILNYIQFHSFRPLFASRLFWVDFDLFRSELQFLRQLGQ